MNKQEIETKYGKTWTTDELQEDFSVKSFLAPYVFVRDRKTGEDGILMFQHMPRFYFNLTKES